MRVCVCASCGRCVVCDSATMSFLGQKIIKTMTVVKIKCMMRVCVCVCCVCVCACVVVHHSFI